MPESTCCDVTHSFFPKARRAHLVVVVAQGEKRGAARVFVDVFISQCTSVCVVAVMALVESAGGAARHEICKVACRNL